LHQLPEAGSHRPSEPFDFLEGNPTPRQAPDKIAARPEPAHIIEPVSVNFHILSLADSCQKSPFFLQLFYRQVAPKNPNKNRTKIAGPKNSFNPAISLSQSEII